MAKVTLFYDADCGFCQGSVDWLLTRALPGTFDPVAYQDDQALREFPMVDASLADKGIQALGPDGKIRAKAAATGYCLTFLPGWSWLGRLILFPLVAPFAALGYLVIARNRHHLSRLMGRTSCRILPRAKR
jgi:predicted DCC family thiol-disulfide oxidoreductase YuxK